MEAMKQKILPIEIVSKYRKLHQQVYKWIDCEFDVFGHTTCDEHTIMVQN